MLRFKVVVVHFLILVSCQQNVLRDLGVSDELLEHESRLLGHCVSTIFVRAAQHSVRGFAGPRPGATLVGLPLIFDFICLLWSKGGTNDKSSNSKSVHTVLHMSVI
jgi:hypothetical protein